MESKKMSTEEIKKTLLDIYGITTERQGEIFKQTRNKFFELIENGTNDRLQHEIDMFKYITTTFEKTNEVYHSSKVAASLFWNEHMYQIGYENYKKDKKLN